MGKKIFVSYKYADNQVKALAGAYQSTARNYVDLIQDKLDSTDHIFKGENDGESLESLADSTIGSKLGDKIFDSTVTIVLISKGMKGNSPEKDQWMPWEISYSLKQQSRQGDNSKTNAVLAVVLPDNFGNYDYFIQDNSCPYCNCRTLKTDFLFQILRDNMFNIINPTHTDCPNHVGNKPYSGYSSYIHSVKWADFYNNINHYIDIALHTRNNISAYNVVKTVK